MKTIALTRGMVALVDDEDHELLSAFSWYAVPKLRGKHWYAMTNVPSDDGAGRKPVYMHRIILDLTRRNDRSDHINGDTLDNRRENLRRCNASQNMWNSKGRSACGFVGVYFNKAKQRFMARIRLSGRTIYLGLFGSAETAAKARDEKAREVHGEFACLNFPRSGERSAITGEIVSDN